MWTIALRNLGSTNEVELDSATSDISPINYGNQVDRITLMIYLQMQRPLYVHAIDGTLDLFKIEIHELDL